MNQRSPLVLLLLMFLAAVVPTRGQSHTGKPEQCLGGQLDAPIIIEVFSDLQCPACRTLYLDTIRFVLKDYCALDKVCVIYHEFPLPAHKYSREAARYSQAAQKLGRKQWLAVLESLYADQVKWSENGNIEAYVLKAVTPEDFLKLKKILQDPSINADIDRELALGEKRKVKSTPTFFVTALNREQRVEGGIPYLVLKQFFDGIVK